MRFLPVRDDALLIELDDLPTTLALFDSLSSDPITGTGELIPGARTLLVFYRPSAVTPEQIVRAVRTRDLDGRVAGEGTLIEIPVTYDGEDLGEVAGLLGLSADEVVRLHTGQDYAVGFTGFAPGFAYLSGGHPALDVPRRSSPRTRIPAGSVALAGTFSGVYPRESPGGWQLIGTTEARMWNLSRERPALLLPGDRVRFVEVSGGGRAAVSVSAASDSAGESSSAPAGTPTAEAEHGLEILDPGMLTLLQDLGRPGYASMGVSTSGALDPVSLRAANRLVGNPSREAALELTFGRLRLRARGEQVLAVTGAPVPLTISTPAGADGGSARTRSVAVGGPFALGAGEELVLGRPTSGLRSYLAVRGGFALDPVLGSLSTDVLAGLGPAPVTAGAVLPVCTPASGIRAVALPGPPTVDAVDAVDASTEVVLDVILGPRTDWFSADAVDALTGQSWLVSARSNRVGLRLEGEPLTRVVGAELPSEGTVSGAIQIPPNGQPVLFLADHPLTGGYPVIGAVATHHLPLAGQLPPGARIRFRPIGPFAAYSLADNPEVTP
ncbi:5-oxoprolinase/urea amidolyase family protein [Cryobacterium adonitolivorans]|uniref:5-oxoprolinase/urea amidolyase family protein n=1 Tax=Cryobacterium adonitolivorans TaxID=1259189 RepID=A0A4R8W7B9_9MICO|nr:5-oxoprolinase/urea amidolyase family protein [Cryobacterium adonitolivorans]TFC04082.1 5-oxoprolinase/urea amidolyase family protein [Cryobacterium adonitolivorans]